MSLVPYHRRKNKANTVSRDKDFKEEVKAVEISRITAEQCTWTYSRDTTEWNSSTTIINDKEFIVYYIELNGIEVSVTQYGDDIRSWKTKDLKLDELLNYYNNLKQ